jgi:hypothetical protein
VKVDVTDLQLTDASGNPVIDPTTGRPAYNPLNKWNNGAASRRGANASGGAIHLTSTPNTLQTELGLAGGATVRRTVGNTNPQKLICCSQFGQAFRNSVRISGRRSTRSCRKATTSRWVVSLRVV